MSLLEKVVLFAEHGDLVERARDPATGQRFPAPSAGVKILAWFARTSWAKRQLLKWITAGAATVTAWLIAHGGSSEQSTAITAGTVAACIFVYEQFVSWLCHKAKLAPPSLDMSMDDDDEPEPSPPARSLATSASPFLPVRQGTFFNPTPSDTMTPEAEPIAPLPRRSPTSGSQRTLILGAKGCKIIAEQTPESGPAETVRGTLRSEADDGALVIIMTDTGIRTLERSDWTFYVESV